MKKNQAVLQVWKDNKWQYVFCLSEHGEIVTTADRTKALPSHALQYFMDRKGNDEFKTDNNERSKQNDYETIQASLSDG